MNPTQRAYLELHIAVFLFGFTAILGDLIQLPAIVLVWWRVLITSFSLLFLIKMGRRLRGIGRKRIMQYMGIGVFVAIHWICFYGAIKLANASIALICMATTSFFTSLIEPFVMKQRLRWYELLIGLLIIPGIALIANTTEVAMLDGLIVGLLSALMAALFATLNKRMIHHADAMSITFLELSSSFLVLSLILPFFLHFSPEAVRFSPSPSDWAYLMVLSLLCTTLAYVLSLRSLQYLSAFAANLTVNLEPIYGIALAWILLDDRQELTTGFYIGCLMILLAVFSYPFIRKKFEHGLVGAGQPEN